MSNDDNAKTIEHDPGETHAAPGTEVTTIREPINPDRTKVIPFGGEQGGIGFQNYGQVIEFAKMMSETGWALPPHLRKSQTGCLAICTRAGWWRMDPYFIAEHSYLVTQKKGGVDVQSLAFDASVFQAVINSRAPIKHRLKHRFEGEGDEMRCVVWTTFVGDTEPTEHISPMLKDRMPAKNEYGKRKGSPLWESKPMVQLAYDTMRDFARLYCQDVLGGIYDKDELLEMEGKIVDAQTEDTPASPNLMERLPGRVEGAGIAEGGVEAGLKGDPHPGTAKKGQPAAKEAAASQAGEPKGAMKAAEGDKDTPQEGKAASSAPAKAKGTRRDWLKEPPKNPKQYRTYLSEWLAAGDDGSALQTRFNSKAEKKLREVASVAYEELDACRQMVKDRLAEL